MTPERIESIRRQIADGTYETPARIDGTVAGLMPELDPPVVAVPPSGVITAGVIAFSFLFVLVCIYVYDGVAAIIRWVGGG